MNINNLGIVFCVLLTACSDQAQNEADSASQVGSALLSKTAYLSVDLDQMLPRDTFFGLFAACTYPFLAAAYELDASELEKNVTVNNFSLALQDIMADDEVLNGRFLRQACDAYTDIAAAETYSRQELIEVANSNSEMKPLINAFIDSIP